MDCTISTLDTLDIPVSTGCVEYTGAYLRLDGLEALRTTCMSDINVKESTLLVNSYQPPRFDTVRHVPLRYREMLPMQVMRQCRCIVVGSGRGVLTVAFDEQPGIHVINGISRLTGQAIFPVLIRPARMNLLLQRIEFWHSCHVSRNHRYYLHRYHVHAMLQMLIFNEVMPGDAT